jgi:uncharacterized membrane protein YccC
MSTAYPTFATRLVFLHQVTNQLLRRVFDSILVSLLGFAAGMLMVRLFFWDQA